MAGSPAGKPAKVMSSRLMTMKFMQRAAASSAATDSSAAEQPSPKRRRLSSNASPSAGNSDLQAIQAALAAEEAKRQQALERQSAEAGETRWMLSFQDAADSSDGRQDQSGLQVISTGYAGIDESVGKHRNDLGSDDESWTNPTVGRRVFGKFKRAQETTSDSSEESSEREEANAQSDSREDDDPSGTKALIKASRAEAAERAKAERKAKRKAVKAEANRLAEQRRGKKIKLNKLTSISGGGGSLSGSMECYNCGSKGHKAKDCPSADKKRHKSSE